MPVTPPKCKFCPHLHWGLCPTIGAAPARVRVIDVPKKSQAAAKPLALPAPPAAKKKAAKKK